MVRTFWSTKANTGGLSPLLTAWFQTNICSNIYFNYPIGVPFVIVIQNDQLTYRWMPRDPLLKAMMLATMEEKQRVV